MENENEHTQCTRTIADDNEGKAKSNECCFIETKSPPFVHLHHQHHQQQQHRQIRARLDDAVMHFSPPSKDSINTDFTNLNAISESGRNSVSRQSLIGECALGGVFVILFRFFVHAWTSVAVAVLVVSLTGLMVFLSSPPCSLLFSHQLSSPIQLFVSLAFISSRMVIVRFPVLLFICCATKKGNFCCSVDCKKRNGPSRSEIWKSSELSLMIHEATGCAVNCEWHSACLVCEFNRWAFVIKETHIWINLSTFRIRIGEAPFMQQKQQQHVNRFNSIYIPCCLWLRPGVDELNFPVYIRL